MKKIGYLALILPFLLISGCKEVDRLEILKQNASERALVYFSSSEGLNVSITSGLREEPYIYDGKSCDKLDFSLIIANLGSFEDELVKLVIDGKESEIVMEYNYLTCVHMADLGYLLTGNEQIELIYGEKSAKIENKSQNFGVSPDEAFEIGYDYCQDYIATLFDGKNFNGEVYLKVLDSLSGGFSEVYYLFSVLGEGDKAKNILISVDEPKVLADGEEIMI